MSGLRLAWWDRFRFSTGGAARTAPASRMSADWTSLRGHHVGRLVDGHAVAAAVSGWAESFRAARSPARVAARRDKRGKPAEAVGSGDRNAIDGRPVPAPPV